MTLEEDFAELAVAVDGQSVAEELWRFEDYELVMDCRLPSWDQRARQTQRSAAHTAQNALRCSSGLD